jgi:hypothetical protein
MVGTAHPTKLTIGYGGASPTLQSEYMSIRGGMIAEMSIRSNSEKFIFFRDCYRGLENGFPHARE